MARSEDVRIFLDVDRSVLSAHEEFGDHEPHRRNKPSDAFSRILPADNSFMKDEIDISCFHDSMNESELPSIILPKDPKLRVSLDDSDDDKHTKSPNAWDIFANHKRPDSEHGAQMEQVVSGRPRVRAIRFEVQETGSIIQR